MITKSAAVIGAALLASIAVPGLTTFASAASVITNPGGIRSLNPQPLPPRLSYSSWRMRYLANRWSIGALNPQPLPPSPCASCPRGNIGAINRVILR
jgi:hypothetical protein